MYKKIILSLIFIFLVSSLYCSCSNRKVSEKLITKVSSSLISERPIISPDCSRIAYFTSEGKFFVNGVEDSRFNGQGLGRILFSPDSKRIAYSDENTVIIDGVIKSYNYVKKDSLLFSPNSKRVAYVAGSQSPDSADKEFAVIDGVESKKYDSIIDGSLIFSPDSKHVSYFAVINDENFLVVDGKESDHYCDSLVFSPDGNHLAYRAIQYPDSFVVMDGAKYKKYCDIKKNSLVFSPDSKRLAYSGYSFVVVDGVEGKYHEDVSDIVFSPDSKRLAYSAFDPFGNKYFVVVDGVEGRHYDSVSDIVFSPDSKRVAYWASVGYKRIVVLDGVEDKQYDGRQMYHPVFSPDSKRLAYSAKVGDKSIVIVDGKEGRQFEDITLVSDWSMWREKYSPIIPFFSPDSRHVVYLIGGVAGEATAVVENGELLYNMILIGAGKATAVVDGKNGKLSYHIIDASKIAFDSNNSFHYIASRIKSDIREFYLVEEKIK